MSNSDAGLPAEERERRARAAAPLEIIVARHAEPDWQAARKSGSDPSLTDLGRRQAERLSRALADSETQALYCSSLQRARETATAIGSALDLAPTIVDGLEEIQLPLLQGASQVEVDAYFKSAARRRFGELWNGWPGGEAFRAFHQRVTVAAETLLAQYGAHPLRKDGFTVWEAPDHGHTVRICIVAHAGTNSVLLTHLLGIEPVPWEWVRFATPLAAYSTVALRAVNEEGYVWSLSSFGRRDEGREP